MLHKIFGIMHDTCSTANLVAELMASVRNDVGEEYFGKDEWDGKDNRAKPMFDFLCGNHTRNLLAVRFEKRHDKYLEAELGEALRAAKIASGGRARLECSGTHFLRSLCKLTHKGFGQYVKGDGDAFSDFLALNYPHITNDGLSRADYSNRQDWALEVSFELYPLLDPLLDYEVKSLLDDPNILRDSVLIQMECLYFEAYVHVGAIMWRVVFKELRGLTNSKGLELNPLTLNWYHIFFASTLNILKTNRFLFRPPKNLNKGSTNSCTIWHSCYKRTIVYQSWTLILDRGRISFKIVADLKSSTQA
jgi:hypothetical protein